MILIEFKFCKLFEIAKLVLCTQPQQNIKP